MTCSAPDPRPIGVFDSGIGGLSVLAALRVELPNSKFAYIADSGHAPYGERGDAFVAARSHAVARHLVDTVGVRALVVACNTATAAAVQEIRACYPGLPVIGIEPGLKPAAQHSRTGRVGVIGTRGTLESARFRALLHIASESGRTAFVVRPCDGLALAVERGLVHSAAHAVTAHAGSAMRGELRTGAAPANGLQRVSADVPSSIAALCRSHLGTMGAFGTGAGEIDTLVLGCTHYVFAADALREVVGPDVVLLDTAAPVARQTRRILEAAIEGGVCAGPELPVAHLNHPVEPGACPTDQHDAAEGRNTAAGTAHLPPIPPRSRSAPLPNTAGVQFFTSGEPTLLAAAAERWLGVTAAKISIFRH